MFPPRRDMVVSLIKDLPYRASYLDVSCGRGEMLAAARDLGFATVTGTEIVPELLGPDVQQASAWALPFGNGSFEVVTMLDTIEHLLPGDDQLACGELQRVAKRVIFVSAANHPSVHSGWELHVNKRPFVEWDRLFRQWFRGRVTWLKDRVVARTEIWRIDLAQ